MKMKNKIIEQGKFSEKLNGVMLEYYALLLEELKSKKSEKEQKEIKEKEEINYIKNMWKNFHALKNKKLIEDLSEILKELIEKKQSVFLHSLNSLSENIQIKEYFMKKGIDTTYIFYKVRTCLDNELDYFEEYGFKEKSRWEKIKIDLQEKSEKFQEEKNQRDFKDKINKFVKKAIEMNLYDASTAHIKNIAVELGEDTNNILNQLTNAVSTQLRKHWGDKPKRNRDLTKSIKIEILRRDNYTCQECGAGKEGGLEIHHIIPHSLGGTDDMDNLITLCKSCNRSIGDRTYNPPKDWIGKKIYPKWKNRK